MFSYATVKRLGCFFQTRLHLQNYNFRVKKTSRLDCFQKLFWAQVTLPNSEKIAINIGSLAKCLKVSRQTVKQLISKNNKLEVIIEKCKKIGPFAKRLAEEESLSLTKSLHLMEEIESQKSFLLATAEKNGFALGIIGKRHLVAHLNPETGSTDLYLSLLKALGHGGFRSVYPLMNYQTSKVSMALSVERPEKPDQKEQMQREYYFLKTLQKVKQVVKPYFLIDCVQSQYLATKRCQGTFDKLIKSNISQKKKLELFKEVLKGVNAIHEHGIIHRDIKPQNILYNHKGKIKIIDFNLSCLNSERDRLTLFCGTASYQPPEVILRKIKEYPEKIDAWSLGIILYQICENQRPEFISLFKEQVHLPSKEQNEGKLIQSVKNLKFHTLKKGDPLLNVIKGLLHVDPQKRISVKVALEKL